MKIKVLASGSKGNCSLIETKSTRFLIDIGITYQRLKKELEHRQRLIELLGKYDFMKIIGGTDGDYVGIISAIMPGFSSDSAGLIFNERNILKR